MYPPFFPGYNSVRNAVTTRVNPVMKNPTVGYMYAFFELNMLFMPSMNIIFWISVRPSGGWAG